MKNIKEFAAVEEIVPEHAHLHDWVFHFNAYTEIWNAIPRNVYNEYWSDSKHPRIIKSRDIFTLLEKVSKV
jgi:hypothetical protein